ncbi:hypothetical protein AU074_13780 [Pseudomonas sp. ATCC PTA-122608]|uniref:hypothetical protein n=1 Tax=Pseudomonas sp. ATCC PTA-122608 TaxID=1771311 RepID=UPI00097A0A7D|nr:hypothetical protein [Pseudomonas sp. ATCC PTA-122608]OLY72240.1 hypothetical protein AU074_13780 [Pseudomonas sp. ATCC PTA-122608]
MTFKSDSDYEQRFVPILNILTEIATEYGYQCDGDFWKDCAGEVVMMLEGFNVKVWGGVSRLMIIDLGVKLRKLKNRQIQIFYGGEIITPKQIKSLIETEIVAS